ncbi:SH3 domain-binding protein 5-like [Anneissia japonica]|uniref:SH3 domain-binding protein 5-like n=1 Tax=Anneissia japonica TaxID=1529436 RepID=UPI0014259C01|nr:SH3 domain-binding protein 5-like [Anneissia japonica]
MATEVEWDDDELDPRIQVELETLNTTSEDINTFEKKLENTRAVFKQTLAECNEKLQLTAKYCGKTVNRALIYYQARKSSHQAQQDVQASVNKYQKAVSVCQAAKETIALAEEASVTGNKTRDFNSALQEMLNHATAKLNAAEKEREESETIHLEKAAVYAMAQKKSDQLKKKYSKSIAKSRVYYEQKYQFETQLLKIKQEVIDVQKLLVEKKKTYRNALDSLEQISEEIHLKRTFSLPLGPREAGVGEDSLEGSCGSEADSLEIKFNDDNDSMSDSASCDSDYFSSAPTSPCSDTSTTLLDSLPELDVMKTFQKSPFKRSSTTNSLEDYISNSLQNLTISKHCEDEIRETYTHIESNIDRCENGGNTEMKNLKLESVKSQADRAEEIAVRSSGEGAVDEEFKE